LKREEKGKEDLRSVLGRSRALGPLALHVSEDKVEDLEVASLLARLEDGLPEPSGAGLERLGDADSDEVRDEKDLQGVIELRVSLVS
jgi:hypothetical protein